MIESVLKSGLADPGRLFDFDVTFEAVSHGELKSSVAGWTISAGFAESHFGPVLIGECPLGICHLVFVESVDGLDELAGLQAAWPQARLCRDDAAASSLAARIFTRPGSDHSGSPLRAFARGTPFQILVWQALLNVGFGALTSYGRLAAAVGKPGGARAVGRAVGQNPLSYLIPCHRVIRENGELGGYRWGLARKLALLNWETSGRIGLMSAQNSRCKGL